MSKLPINNIETLSQKQKMNETFSPSQDVGTYLNGGKSLGEQDSLVETWIIIGESGLMQLLINKDKKIGFFSLNIVEKSVIG